MRCVADQVYFAAAIALMTTSLGILLFRTSLSNFGENNFSLVKLGALAVSLSPEAAMGPPPGNFNDSFRS